MAQLTGLLHSPSTADSVISDCRSCLDSEAPPSLIAAAADLAAGLAGSDPLLLTHLMAQLNSLLYTDY